jgi:hypothetical protein
MPNDTKITTMTQRSMARRRYDPAPFSAMLKDVFMPVTSFLGIDDSRRFEARS